MSKAKEVDRAQELRKNIDTMDACVAAGKNWPFVISTGAIRHVLDELDAARAALSASSEQQAAQQDAEPLKDERILRLQETHVGDICPSYPLSVGDWINFARAIEMAHGIAARASNGGKA